MAQPGRDLLLGHPTQGADPQDFADLAQVQARLLAFQDHYAEIAAPFEWKFTTADLHALLARSADHDHQPLAQAA